ncbi:MAG: hypothetical protein AB1816_19915, partial [Bacillota bacterium]
MGSPLAGSKRIRRSGMARAVGTVLSVLVLLGGLLVVLGPPAGCLQSSRGGGSPAAAESGAGGTPGSAAGSPPGSASGSTPGGAPGGAGSRPPVFDLLPAEAEELARRFLPEGAQLTEVAPTGATAWGALARAPAVQTIRFWPEGELLILAGYRRDPGRAGAMLLGRRASGWEKLWSEEQDGCGIERLQLADVLGEGKPQLLVGWDAGPSLGGRLEVLSWTGNGLESVALLGYHRLDVVDLSGTYARDGRCELAVWTKDTGDAYAVEVYRWHEGRFVPAPDTYRTYYPTVVDYYAQRTREHPDVRAYWYYLALAQVRAQEARAALDSLVRARGLDGHPADAALFLVEGDA